VSKTLHPVDIYVGKRLEAVRKSRGVTQQDLGRALGVTFQQVQKYLRGTNRISAGKLYEASRYLNCDVSYFFEGAEHVENNGTSLSFEPPSTPYTHSDLTKDINDISNPNLQAALKALIREIKT
jgi:transcriptional regulator with XRE-family HTH domain